VSQISQKNVGWRNAGFLTSIAMTCMHDLKFGIFFRTVHQPTSCEAETFPFDDSTCYVQYLIIWDTILHQYVIYVKNFEETGKRRICKY